MTTDDEINQQQHLLTTHRRTLAHLLRQAAQYGGEPFAPPATANGIAEARASIQRIKATLRTSGVTVEDRDDEIASQSTLSPVAFSPQDGRYRTRTLAQVREFWVQGVLENSLHGAALIALGLESRPDTVAYPWQMVVERPGQATRPLPAGTTLTEVFDELGGELLILGAPGAGKTTMLLDLARTLLDRAERDTTHPIPVVFSLSLWEEQHSSFAGWLENELSDKYGVPKKVGRAWVDGGHIIPLLDGLDEVKSERRDICVAHINTFWQEHGQSLVVCSRLADYEALTNRLRVRGAVLIQPLTSAQIEQYLDQAGGQLAALRTSLQADSALRELAESPLMLSMMALTYQGQSSDILAARMSPEARQQQLFEAYVQRMLARPRTDAPTSSQQMVSWLAWLARGMLEHNQSVFYLENLQPTWLASRSQRIGYGLGVRFIIAALSALIGVLCGVLVGLFAGGGSILYVGALLGGILGGLTGGLSVELVIPALDLWGVTGRITMIEKLSWSWKNTRAALRPSPSLTRGLLLGVIIGIMLGVIGGAISHLNNKVVLETASTVNKGLLEQLPNEGGAESLRGIIGGLVGGFAIAVAASWLISLLNHLRRPRFVHQGQRKRDLWRSARRTVIGEANSKLMVGLGAGLMIGLGTGLGVSLSGGRGIAVVLGVGVGLAGGAVSWLLLACVQGVTYEQSRPRIKVNQGIWRTAWSAVISGLGGAVLIGSIGVVSGGLFGALTVALAGRLFAGVVGPLFDHILVEFGGGLRGGLLSGALLGLITGVACGGIYGATDLGGKTCCQHACLRFILWRSGGMPLNYARFLDEAGKRILLRRVGNGYIFMHRLLLEHFAQRATLQPGAMLTNYAWAIAERGMTYQAMERYEEALADLTRAIELDPKYMSAFVRRAGTYYRMGRYEEALADLTHAIELSPKSSWALGERAVLYREMERYEEALADLSLAIQINPQSDDAIAERGRTYQHMERYDEAFADQTRAIQLNPKLAWAIADRGITNRELGRLEETLADLNRALELAPNTAWMIAQRGRTYQRMERYEEALADLNRAIELNPKLAWVIAERGITYHALGRYEQALADLNRALGLAPNTAWMIAQRGRTYQRMERYEEALADLNHAIELNPKLAWVIAGRGITYREIGRYKEALADLNHAIELNPKLAWMIAERGITYREIGRYKEVLADLNRAIELDSKTGWIIRERGVTYRRMGQYEEALADLSRAMELEPKNIRSIGQRAMVYQRMGRYEEAVADHTLAIELDPENARPRYYRALTLQRSGQYDRAQTDLTVAIQRAKQHYEQRPSVSRNAFDLALCHLANSDFDSSERLYRDALCLGATLGSLRDAIHDLDAFLTLFPEHLHAYMIWDMLQAHAHDDLGGEGLRAADVEATKGK